MSKSVQAELRYVVSTPGILKYLGLRDSLTIYTAAYQPAINSTDFVRNVDLAWDMGNFFLKKLGLDGKAQKLGETFDKVKNFFVLTGEGSVCSYFAGNREDRSAYF